MKYKQAISNARILCDPANPEYTRGIVEFIQMWFGGDVEKITEDIYKESI